MPGRVTLRAAVPADVPAVAEIWQHGWRDGHLGHVPEELVALRTPDSFRSRAHDLVSEDTVVAVVDGVVAGFVAVVHDEVDQLFVAREHRGTRVAPALLAEAERLVHAKGHLRATLVVVAGNARARRFYERHGWTDDGAIDDLAATEAGPIPVPSRRYVKFRR